MSQGHIKKETPNIEPFEIVNGVPVFKPTLEEFRDFNYFVKNINHYGMESGIVKIIPPKEWLERIHNNTQDEAELLSKIVIESPIEQNMSSNKKLSTGGMCGINITNIEKNKKYNIIQWKEISYDYNLPTLSSLKKLQHRDNTSSISSSRSPSQASPSQSPSPPIRKRNTKITSKKLADFNISDFQQFVKENSVTSSNDIEMDDNLIAGLEEYYWKNILLSTPMYGADCLGTLFDENEKIWNVSKLPSLLNYLDDDIPGVNKSYLYAGLWKSTFSWHLEDQDLHSINYLHFGSPKQWYAIPQEDHLKFFQLMKDLFPEDHQNCKEFLRHKTFHCNPKILLQHGIKVNKIVHYANEFIITFPNGYHSGFNYGFNLAESVNFAIEDWLEIGLKSERCKCIDDSVSVDVSSLQKKLNEKRLNRDDIGGNNTSQQRKKLKKSLSSSSYSSSNPFVLENQGDIKIKDEPVKKEEEGEEEEEGEREKDDADDNDDGGEKFFRKKTQEFNIGPSFTPLQSFNPNIPDSRSNSDISLLNNTNNIMKKNGVAKNSNIQLPLLNGNANTGGHSPKPVIHSAPSASLTNNNIPSSSASLNISNPIPHNVSHGSVISRLSSPLLSRIFNENDSLLDYQKKIGNGPNTMLSNKSVSSPLTSSTLPLSKKGSGFSNNGNSNNNNSTINNNNVHQNQLLQQPSASLNDGQALPSPTLNIFKSDLNPFPRFNSPSTSSIPKLNLNSTNGTSEFGSDSNNGYNKSYHKNNKNVAKNNTLNNRSTNNPNSNNNNGSLLLGSSLFDVGDDDDNMLAMSLTSMANSRVSSPRLNMIPLSVNTGSNLMNNTQSYNPQTTPTMPTSTRSVNSPFTNYFNNTLMESQSNQQHNPNQQQHNQHHQHHHHHNIHPNHPINQLINAHQSSGSQPLLSPKPTFQSGANSLPSLGLSNSGTPIVGPSNLLNQHNSLLTTATTAAAVAAQAAVLNSSGAHRNGGTQANESNSLNGNAMASGRSNSMGLSGLVTPTGASSTNIGILRPKSPQSPYLGRGRSPNRVMLNISRDGSPLSSFQLNNPNLSSNTQSTNISNLVNPHQPFITTSLSQIIAANNSTFNSKKNDSNNEAQTKKRKYIKKTPKKKQLSRNNLMTQNASNQEEPSFNTSFAESTSSNNATIGSALTNSLPVNGNGSGNSAFRPGNQGLMSGISPIIPSSDALLSAQRYHMEPEPKQGFPSLNENNEKMDSAASSFCDNSNESFLTSHNGSLIGDSVDIPTNENELHNANLKVQDDEVVIADDGIKTYVCIICNKPFSSGHHLTRHKNSVHCEAKPFSCPKCAKPFKRRDHVLQHLNKKIPCIKDYPGQSTNSESNPESSSSKIVI